MVSLSAPLLSASNRRSLHGLDHLSRLSFRQIRLLKPVSTSGAEDLILKLYIKV